MSIKSKVISLLYNLIPESFVNTQTGVISYGSDNLVPNHLINAIASSGTAANCAKTLKIFIEADGFTGGEGKIRVNPKQTADELLAGVAYSQAIYKGFALNILYRNDGEIGSVYLMSFNKIRKTSGEQIVYNDTIGTKKYKKSEDVYYPPFDPKRYTSQERADRILQEIEDFGYQLGEVLYTFEENPYIEDYPYSNASIGIKDIISDGSLTNLDNRNITKGFRPTVIISTVGDLDDTSKGGAGATEADQFDANLKSFTGDDAATILHLEASTKDGLPQVTQFPLSEQLDGVENATERVSRKVCRLFSCPPVLVGFDVAAILGNTQAIANGIKILNANVLPDQNLITRAFKMIWPVPDWTISTMSLISYIPSEILAKLSTDEIRAIGGFPPVATEGQTSEITLAEKIGVGGVTALTGIISNPLLSDDQKTQSIVQIFGISEENARLLVFGKSTPPTPPV